MGLVPITGRNGGNSLERAVSIQPPRPAVVLGTPLICVVPNPKWTGT